MISAKPCLAADREAHRALELGEALDPLAREPQLAGEAREAAEQRERRIARFARQLLEGGAVLHDGEEGRLRGRCRPRSCALPGC